VSLRSKADCAAIVCPFPASSRYRNRGERQDDRIYRMKPGWPCSGLSFLNPVHPVNSHGNLADQDAAVKGAPAWPAGTKAELPQKITKIAKNINIRSYPCVLCVPLRQKSWWICMILHHRQRKIASKLLCV
jgi:hypothetical protein